jgi:hypothetical protein
MNNKNFTLCFLYNDTLYREGDVLLIGEKEASRGKGLICFGVHDGEVVPGVIVEWLLSDEKGNFVPLEYYLNRAFKNCVNRIGNVNDTPALWPFTRKINYGEENEEKS